MKQSFKKFDCAGYPAPGWIDDYILKLFQNPKTERAWDIREPDQLDRLAALALGVIQFLKTLPDGAEIGTNDLAAKIAPEMWADMPYGARFLLRRIERCRYGHLLDGYFYTLPDNRWKVPRTFYKYHNGRKTHGKV